MDFFVLPAFGILGYLQISCINYNGGPFYNHIAYASKTIRNCVAVNILFPFHAWFFQVRNQLAIQVTNLQVDLDNVSAQLDEEAAAAANANVQLQRAVTDLQQLKSKYDKEVVALSQQLDETR